MEHSVSVPQRLIALFLCICLLMVLIPFRHPGGGRAEPALLHGAVSPARAGARRGAAITEITQTALLREGRLLLQRTFLPDIGVCITGRFVV